MKCCACDKELTDYETSRKSEETGEYIDMCLSCFKHIQDDVAAYGNPSLVHVEDE